MVMNLSEKRYVRSFYGILRPFMPRTLLKETLAELFQWMLVGQIIATFGAWIIVDWVKSFLLSAVVIDKDDIWVLLPFGTGAGQCQV